MEQERPEISTSLGPRGGRGEELDGCALSLGKLGLLKGSEDFGGGEGLAFSELAW